MNLSLFMFKLCVFETTENPRNPEIYLFNKNLQREWLKFVQVAVDQFHFLEQAVSRALCVQRCIQTQTQSLKLIEDLSW